MQENVNIEPLNTDSIKYKLQNILDKNHQNLEKRVIKSNPNEYNPTSFQMACPVCGDSSKNVYKKRGELYLDTLKFVCHKGCSSMYFTDLCKKFGEKIEFDEKMKLYKYIDDRKITRDSVDIVFNSLDKLILIDDFVKTFNEREDSWLINISPIKNGSPAYKYMSSRHLPNFDNIYEGTYRVINDGIVRYKTDVIINMNTCRDRLVGIQLRNFCPDKNNRMYKIVDFEEIYTFMFKDSLDEIEALSYNKLSHFYNILNIDFNRPINIFEGFIDSKLSPNSIGMVGKGNVKDLLKFFTDADDDIKMRFFMDNDAQGILTTLDLLKSGHSVFLWNKLFRDLISKSETKLKTKYELKEIVDLNDMSKLYSDPKIYRNLNMDNYFSKDKFDIMFIDKPIYDRINKTYSVKKVMNF